MTAKLIVALVLGLLLVVFTVQNTQVVEVRFLVFRVEMSRSILIFGVFAVGALSGWLVTGPGRRIHR